MTKLVEEIRGALKDSKLIVGTERTIKKLKAGKLKKVYVSANCPEKVKNNLTHYGGGSNTPVVDVPQHNDELGIICKKSFPISVLGLEE